MYAPLITMVNNLIDNVLVLFIFVAISMFYRLKTDLITSAYKSDLNALKTQLDAEIKRIDANLEMLEKFMHNTINALQSNQESKHQELKDVAQARYEAVMTNIKDKGG